MADWFQQNAPQKPQGDWFESNKPTAGPEPKGSLKQGLSLWWDKVKKDLTTPKLPVGQLIRELLPKEKMSPTKEALAGGAMVYGDLMENLSTPTTAGLGLGVGAASEMGLPGLIVSLGFGGDQLRRAWQNLKKTKELPPDALPREKVAGYGTSAIDTLMALVPFAKEAQASRGMISKPKTMRFEPGKPTKSAIPAKAAPMPPAVPVAPTMPPPIETREPWYVKNPPQTEAKMPVKKTAPAWSRPAPTPEYFPGYGHVEPEAYAHVKGLIDERMQGALDLFESGVGEVSGKAKNIEGIENMSYEAAQGERTGFGPVPVKNAFPELASIKGSPAAIADAIRRDKNNPKYLQIRDAMTDAVFREHADTIANLNENAVVNREERLGLQGIFGDESGFADISKPKKPRSKDMTEFYKKIDQYNAEVKAHVEKNLGASKDADAIELRETDPEKADRYVIIHQSPNSPGKWQASMFDKDGPWGHEIFNSKEEAIRSYSGEAVNGPPYGTKGQYIVSRIKKLKTGEEGFADISRRPKSKRLPGESVPFEDLTGQAWMLPDGSVVKVNDHWTAMEEFLGKKVASFKDAADQGMIRIRKAPRTLDVETFAPEASPSQRQVLLKYARENPESSLTWEGRGKDWTKKWGTDWDSLRKRLFGEEGFADISTKKGYEEQRFPTSWPYRVELPNDIKAAELGEFFNPEYPGQSPNIFVDEVKGLNAGHADWRAKGNWPYAKVSRIFGPESELGFADINRKQKGLSFEPMDIPGASKQDSLNDLIGRVLTAPDSSVSKRDILGMKPRRPAKISETPLFEDQGLNFQNPSPQELDRQFSQQILGNRPVSDMFDYNQSMKNTDVDMSLADQIFGRRK